MLKRLAAALLLTGVPCYGHAVTGRQLLNYCTEFVSKWGTGGSLDGLDTGFCIGYMQGVLDSADLSRSTGSKPSFCYPESEKVDQAIRVVEKHLRGNPGMLHVSAVSQVNLALSRAFPCKR